MEVLDNQQATTRIDMGWLVGFIEGEGSFILNKQVFKKQKAVLRPIVHISSTDFELTERAGRILKGLNIGHFFQRRRFGAKGHKDQLVLEVIGMKRCKPLLETILPYMTDSRRKDAAENLLAFCNLRLSKQHSAPYGDEEFALGQRQRDLNGYNLRQSFRDSTRDVFVYKTKVESASLGN